MISIEQTITFFVIAKVENEAFINKIVDVSWRYKSHTFYLALHKEIFLNF
jgi:hypothetical protein